MIWIWLAPLAAGWLLLLLHTMRKRRAREIDLGFVARTPERRAMFLDAENRRRQDEEPSRVE